MSNKKFFFIVTFIIILIILVFSQILYLSTTNQEKGKSEEIETEKIESTIKMYDEILETDTYTEILSEYYEDVSNKDIELTKIFNQENDKTAKEKTIENTVLLQEIRKNNIQLNKTDSDYIQEIIEGLKKDTIINNEYSEAEKTQILNDIYVKLYNDALINQFISQITNEISDKTYIPDSENLSKQYNEYLKIQEKWDNKENISYSELLKAREKFIDEYIKELLSKSVIE